MQRLLATSGIFVAVLVVGVLIGALTVGLVSGGSGDANTFPATGDVGIGTTDPKTMLDIDTDLGYIRLGTGAGVDLSPHQIGITVSNTTGESTKDAIIDIRTKSSSGGNAELRFATRAQHGTKEWTLGQRAGTDDLFFVGSNDVADNQVVLLLSDEGDVIIGTSDAPNSALQVVGDYIQFPTVDDAPGTGDCQDGDEGRVVVQIGTGAGTERLFFCGKIGWHGVG